MSIVYLCLAIDPLPCFFFCTKLAGCFKRFFKSGKLFAEIKEYKGHSLLKSNNKFNRSKMSVFFTGNARARTQNKTEDVVAFALHLRSVLYIGSILGKERG